MWGVGKTRSKLGKWLDSRGLSQQELGKEAKVSKNTLSRVSNDPEYIPRRDVMKKILDAIRKIDPEAKMSDFWDM